MNRWWIVAALALVVFAAMVARVWPDGLDQTERDELATVEARLLRRR